MTATEAIANQLPEVTATATPSPVAQVTKPSDAVEPPRRGARWGAVLAIAVAAAGVGVLVGSRLRRTTGAPSATAGMAGMPDAVPAPPPNAGSNAVYISPGRQQLVGVRSGLVARQRVEGTVRTVGTLAYDETRTAQIHTRVSGWIEQLFVDYVGKPVRRGQPLFALYSPDLSTAQADYLVALRARQQLGDSAGTDAKATTDALLAASRERMKRWDVSDAQIAELERAGHPARTMTIASPFDGVVLEKNAIAGQYVTPDMMAFRLGDLSTIWVVGQVLEYEAAQIHPGDPIDVEFPYGQAAKLQARIAFVYPDLDPQTRRVRFRAVLPNKDQTLKPDTYVTLVWHGRATDRLALPKEAVIDTGERKYVLLALANGYFEPRDVRIGPPIGDFYPVLAGVVEGDRVVTSAQFLIDSETNLMSAMKGMAMSMPGMDLGKPTPESAPRVKPAGSAAPTPPTAGSAAPAPMPPMPGM